MNEFIVRVEHLGKKYRIWHQAQRPPYVALRDVITRGVADAARSVLRSVEILPTTHSNRRVLRGASGVLQRLRPQTFQTLQDVGRPPEHVPASHDPPH